MCSMVWMTRSARDLFFFFVEFTIVGVFMFWLLGDPSFSPPISFFSPGLCDTLELFGVYFRTPSTKLFTYIHHKIKFKTCGEYRRGNGHQLGLLAKTVESFPFMLWRWRNKLKWAPFELFAPSSSLQVRSWLHPFKGHYEQKTMRDEGVIYVAGHPLLNRRCTRLPGCFYFPKRKL